MLTQECHKVINMTFVYFDLQGSRDSQECYIGLKAQSKAILFMDNCCYENVRGDCRTIPMDESYSTLYSISVTGVFRKFPLLLMTALTLLEIRCREHILFVVLVWENSFTVIICYNSVVMSITAVHAVASYEFCLLVQ